ncbi:peptide/nickel transport system permease protein [Chitinophaga skermanii]|uniref:Peptide/nickel transport system permease protein n=1 Tax=Chitinophaga skermanii TaxID=331697 RepID=A0A327R0Q3_9BACT|nr:ABC transporter permease [Chitinophaga skermanii]RAJ10466.1 peptide/nickel transport system permease protein [Chitinophaga skermanii]
MQQPNSDASFTTRAWKRLRRNKAAIAGLVVIVCSILVAIFAYCIAPDNTPNANRMILEVSGQKPGFTVNMLAVKKSRDIESPNFFQFLLNGKESPDTWIPIRQYHFEGHQLVIEKYIDETLSATEKLPLSQILYGSTEAVQTDTTLLQAAVAERIQPFTYWLGSDKFGRDILSRLIVGTRVSLSVGSIAVLISLSIGIFLGAIAGYFRGWIDELVMWFINVIWAVPTLLLVFAITLALGKGFWQVFIAVGLTMWVSVARIIRGQVLGIRELQFVEATRALGYSHRRTIVKHILPNILGPVVVIAASNFATAIVVEAGLSFLGVGVQPPQPSWGLMIKENYNFIITHNPLLALAPGVAIMILVLAFNLLGNGLRDAMDVKGKL